MTDLSLTFADIYREVSNFLGLGLSPAGEKLALARKYANDGYRLFLMGLDPRTQRAYQWSFLAPAAGLDLWASVPTDERVTVSGEHADGTTTLTASGGAPFYPSMVGRTITIADVGSFPISGCKSPGVILVKGDAACEDKTFSIAADGSYGLPADFAAIIDDPVPAGAAASAGIGPVWARGAYLAPRSAAYVRQLHAVGGAGTGAPQYYAVVPRAFAAAEGQRYDMLVWPTPSASMTVRYRYRVEPDALSADGDLPLGGPQHSLTILQAALAVAEQRHNDARGIHTEQFERLMAFSIDLDAANKPHNLGEGGGGDAAGQGERPINQVSYR